MGVAVDHVAPPAPVRNPRAQRKAVKPGLSDLLVVGLNLSLHFVDWLPRCYAVAGWPCLNKIVIVQRSKSYKAEIIMVVCIGALRIVRRTVSLSCVASINMGECRVFI